MTSVANPTAAAPTDDPRWRAAPGHDPGHRCRSCGQPIGYWLTDKLTGLLDRWGWDDEAARAIAAARRRESPVALLILDLDQFKQVNDRFGHLAGDEVLRAVADVLRGVSRDGDILGRYGGHGGDEFLVLLPDTDRATALALAEQARLGVRGLTLTVDDGCGGPATSLDRITVSIGVAGGLADVADTLLCLLAKADAALREAKRNGRDRVCDRTGGYPAPA